MTPPAASRGEQTRIRLLEATVRVGARNGWGGITTRGVAEEADVNPGLVHYHYGTVDALRRAAVGHVMAALVETSFAGLAETGDPAAAVAGMLDAVATASGPGDDLSVFLYESFLAARRDEQLRHDLAAVLYQARAGLARWIDELSAGDPDRPDPAAVAALLVAALDGIYIHRLLDASVDPNILAAPIRALITPRRDPP